MDTKYAPNGKSPADCLPGDLVATSAGLIYEVEFVNKTHANLVRHGYGGEHGYTAMRTNKDVVGVSVVEPVVSHKYAHIYEGSRSMTFGERETARLSHSIGTIRVTFTDGVPTGAELL